MPTLNLPSEYLRELREVLDTHVPEAEVWAYGSRVKGESHEGSDLDLVLRNPEHPEQPQKGLGALRGALEDSDLPIVVESLDWARLPEDFRREIEQCHVVVREALPAAK